MATVKASENEPTSTSDKDSDHMLPKSNHVPKPPESGKTDSPESTHRHARIKGLGDNSNVVMTNGISDDNGVKNNGNEKGAEKGVKEIMDKQKLHRSHGSNNGEIINSNNVEKQREESAADKGSPKKTKRKDGEEVARPDPDELDSVMKSVYLGRCAFTELPPLTKKVVRIFVSSTFSGRLLISVFKSHFR